MIKKISVLLAVIVLACAVFAQKTEDERSWNQPVEPFKIVGNVYYVGASDITSFLITSPKGHVLIDSGFVETVPQITANIAKLGFKLTDVKVLLCNHAHYDHCAGLAELKRLTGAKLYASPPDAPVLESGARTDFYFRDKEGAWFDPVKVDKILADGEKIELGGTSLTTVFTHGHTKGATSWTTEVRDGGRKYKVAFVSSLTTLDYNLTGERDYPQIGDDFRRTFAALEKLSPDVFLTSHGSFCGLEGKIRRMKAGAKVNPFVDPKGYKALIARMKASFEKRLKEDRQKK